MSAGADKVRVPEGPGGRGAKTSEEPRGPRGRASLLLSDLNLRLCAAAAAVFVLMPPEGLGYDLCMFRQVLHLPCPGCGMTRSGANLVRGHFARAVNFHPLGVVLVPVCFGLGLLALCPRRWRDAARRALAPWERWLRWGLTAFLIALVAFGVVRAFGVWRGWMSFPADWL